MAYKSSDPSVGLPTIDDISSTPKVPLGTTSFFTDDAGGGEGKFIYLLGVASTVAGDAVVYSSLTYQTTRAVSASRGHIAVAMAAIGAGSYGWYQVNGRAAVNAVAAAANGLCYLTATPGQIDNAVVATQGIDGMRTMSAKGTPIAAQCYVQMREAFANNQG
jgi:hypothetical protein